MGLGEVQEEVTLQESEETIQSETEEEPEKPTLPEYHETLYTKESTPKKDKETYSHTTWRDIKAIEEKVDNLNKVEAKKPKSKLDKTVDEILSKNKKK